MTTPNDPTESIESLDALIASYIQEVEAGRTPDRSKLIGQHPDHASALVAFFADFDRMDRVTSPLRLARDPGATSELGSDGRIDPATVRYFGDYELLDEIARGGMGVVYKARQSSLNRLVALKMILAGTFASHREVERFHSEAEAAASLDHPGIVPIFEVGEHQNQHYFSMKLIEGGSLSGEVDRLRADPRATARIMSAVARALHHAHQRGVLHRDLKPANILIDGREQPHVTDFGLARRFEADRGLTQTGVVMGTPSYMAPEQAAGKTRELTTATDVYSLGAILYELLTGRPPFRGETVLETLLLVKEREPSRPRSINPEADRDLETIAMKCLEKEPRKRYGSAAELADDLDRYLIGEPISARQASSIERLDKWARRRPAAAALTVLSVLAVLGGLAGLTISNRLIADREVRANNALGDLREAQEALKSRQKETDAALQRERQDGYDRRIVQAKGEWTANDPSRAEEILNDCEPVRRGWEWNYLGKLCHAELRDFWGAPRAIHAIRFTSDGKRLAIAGGSLGFPSSGPRSLRIWDLSSGRAEPEFFPENDRDGALTGMAFDPEGRRVAISIWCDDDSRDYGPGHVEVWDLVERRKVHSIGGHESFVLGVDYSPDGRWIASAGLDRTARIYDASTGGPVHVNAETSQSQLVGR